MSSGQSSSNEATASPPPVSKKRKRDTQQSQDEIEIDVSAPEPPSKKALRKAKKKGTSITAEDKLQAKNGKPAKQDAKPHFDDKSSSLTIPKKSEHGIWIGNLPFTTTKDNLLKFLTSNTTISEDQVIRVKMPVPKDTGNDNVSSKLSSQRQKPQNKGFAYVDFSMELAKTQAIALSEKLLMGRAVLIKDALSFEGRPEPIERDAGGKMQIGKPPTKRIFVGNLSFDATKETVELHFSKCGPVEQVFLATFEDTGKCKGYGWVTFEEVEAASAAVRGWVDLKADSEDEEAESSDDHDDQKAAKKKRKPRKWWVNRMEGRQLRTEFAEDPTTRYKKRFGKEAKATKSAVEETNSDEIFSEKTPSTISKSRDKPKREDTAQNQVFKPHKKISRKDGPVDRILEKMRGDIVIAEGKKTTFDWSDVESSQRGLLMGNLTCFHIPNHCIKGYQNLSSQRRHRSRNHPLPPFPTQEVRSFLRILLHRIPIHLQTRLITPHHRLLIHPHATLHQRPNTARESRNLQPRSNADLIVLARVDGPARRLFKPCDRHLRLLFGDVFGDPYVPVHAQNDIDLPTAVTGVDRPYLSSGSYYPSAAACSGDGEEDTIAQFSVLETPGM